MSEKSPPARASRAPILLDFEPVTRKVKRPDAWTPELQRQFIALLAETGSPQQAAVIMDKKLSGMRALYDQEGSDSFRAAWDHALAIGEKKMADEALFGVQSRLRAFREGAGADDSEPDPVDPEAESMSEDGKLAIFDRLIAKFMAKVGLERSARIAGRVAEADFYLRQVTCLEVAFDVMAAGGGMDGWHAIARFRRGGHNVLEIADTLMSRMLDAARREQWAKMGEPQRPEHPAEHYVQDHGSHRIEPLQCLGRASAAPPGVDPRKWSEMDHEEQQRALAELHAKEAAAQVEWEARNAAEPEEWRAKHRGQDE